MSRVYRHTLRNETGFAPDPTSIRQRILALLPTDAALSAPEVAAILEDDTATLRTVRATLSELVKDGYATPEGYAPRKGNRGTPWRRYRRLSERRERPDEAFLAAKRLVESRGFVLVPRRPLP